MRDDADDDHVAFSGTTRVGSGTLAEVAVAARRAQDRTPDAAVLVFDRRTGEVVDLDLRGEDREILARLPARGPARRGRPKLGVVPREVTLLPRHWEWLARQPGGASVTLRRLVEGARKADAGGEEARTRAAAYRFLSAMASDLPGFEEAARALFAGDRVQLGQRMATWPSDIRDEALTFAAQCPVRAR